MTFMPVTVSKGRKFRGFGYIVSDERTYGSFGTVSVKIWDPANRSYAYVNVDFCVCPEVDKNPEQTLADKEMYLKWVLDNQLAWCKAQKPSADDNEIRRFARNCLCKHMPELKEWIDSVLPIQDNDVVEKIEQTFKWCAGLTTRACYMYGRRCPGGKPIADKKKAEIAYKSLQKKGLTAHPQFKQLWQFFIEQYSWPNVMVC